MAGSIGPSSAKKQKRSAPVARVSAEDKAKQFKEDLYADGKVLFCKYCQYSIDYIISCRHNQRSFEIQKAYF